MPAPVPSHRTSASWGKAACRLGLLVVLSAGCTSLDSFERLEPRSRDSVPVTVGKTLVYVPVVVVNTAIVVAAAIVFSAAQSTGRDLRVERDLDPLGDHERVVFY